MKGREGGKVGRGLEKEEKNEGEEEGPHWLSAFAMQVNFDHGLPFSDTVFGKTPQYQHTQCLLETSALSIVMNANICPVCFLASWYSVPPVPCCLPPEHCQLPGCEIVQPYLQKCSPL